MQGEHLARVAGIYKIQCNTTSKVYVGSAINLHRRFRGHRALLLAGRHHSVKLQRAWDKYGPAAFEMSALELVPEKSKLIEREQFWIDALDAVSGYNILPTAGSPLGRVLSQETRRKIAERHTGKPKPTWTPECREAHMAALKPWKHTEETLARMRVVQSGKTMSEAARAKISAAQKLRAPVSEETRRKLAEAGKGRVFSDETRAKISAAHAGRKNGPMSEEAKAHRSALMQGKKWTPEQIAKRVATKRAKREAAQE